MTTTTLARPAAAAATDHIRRLPDLPPPIVAAARSRIDAWLGAGMPDGARAHLPVAERLSHYRYSSYGDDELVGSAPLTDCLQHCDPFVRNAIGADARQGDLQIALRFAGEVGYPHVDGINDTSRLDDPLVPSAVLAIYLSDVGPADGPLGIWPHLRPDVLRYGRRCVSDPGHDPGCGAFRALMRGASQRPSRAVTGRAGSVFLVAGNLPHCNLRNAGSGLRHALFLRFYGSRHYPLPHGLDAPNGPGAFRVLADPQPLTG